MMPRGTIKEMRIIARSRGGECQSEKYVDAHTKLTWRCGGGHVWEANPNNIKRGSWCPICGKVRAGHTRRLSIEEMQELARSQGGECLSTEYRNTDTKLEWKCEVGHVWWALPSSVKKGHWCPQCAGNIPLDLSHAQSIAHARGGECLSRAYKSGKHKLKWQCAEGHTWSAPLARIKSGNWCPTCSTGLGERICRAYFEQMFGAKFPTVWPDWLVNSDGHRMELDGYNERLGVAFEHQGLQHYHEVSAFHTPAQFTKRKRDDRTKQKLCKERKILLIAVPQIPARLSITRLREYILNECDRQGFRYPKEARTKSISLRDAYSPDARKRLVEIQTVAASHGGQCLSPAYVGAVGHLKFRCEQGHEWQAIAYSVIKGHWCPKCSVARRGLSRRLGIPKLQEIAKSRGGRLLSTEYTNANTPVMWECAKGHRWWAIPNSVKRGSWCLKCTGKARKMIEDMQALATACGGTCLSRTYMNGKTKLRWRCSHGHTWEAIPNDISSGRWCPYCAGRRKASKIPGQHSK